MRLKHGTMGIGVGHALPVVQIDLRPPVNDGKPIEVNYDGPPVVDNGLTLYFSDAPAGAEPTVDDLHPVCVHCIMRSHPTIGRGLKVAERHGGAVFVDGKWQPMQRPA